MIFADFGDQPCELQSMNEFAQAGAEFVEFECSQCATRLKVSAAIIGQSAKCPKCASVSRVPGPKPPGESGLNSPVVAPVDVNPKVKTEKSSNGLPGQEIGTETETRKLYRRITEAALRLQSLEFPDAALIGMGHCHLHGGTHRSRHEKVDSRCAPREHRLSRT